MLGIPFTASGLKERRRLSSTSLIDGIAVLQFQEEMLKLLSVEISDENLKVEKVVSNRRDGTLYVHPKEDGLVVTWGSMTGLPDPLRQDFTITVVRKQNKKEPNQIITAQRASRVAD